MVSFECVGRLSLLTGTAIFWGRREHVPCQGQGIHSQLDAGSTLSLHLPGQHRELLPRLAWLSTSGGSPHCRCGEITHPRCFLGGSGRAGADAPFPDFPAPSPPSAGTTELREAPRAADGAEGKANTRFPKAVVVCARELSFAVPVEGSRDAN